MIYCLHFIFNSSDSYGHVTIQSKPLPYSNSVHCKLLKYSTYFVGIIENHHFLVLFSMNIELLFLKIFIENIQSCQMMYN